MNNLLIFFALPIATILLAIVLEKILRVPILTAITFFAIYLIVTFTAFDASFLVYAIVYTILAYITAVIAEYFYDRNEEDENETGCGCGCNRSTNDIENTNINNIINGRRNYYYRR